MNEIDLRQRAEDMPLGVSLRIMSAPASFALPMVQRKPFKPAFQVTLTLDSLHPWHKSASLRQVQVDRPAILAWLVCRKEFCCGQHADSLRASWDVLQCRRQL